MVVCEIGGAWNFVDSAILLLFRRISVIPAILDVMGIIVNFWIGRLIIHIDQK